MSDKSLEILPQKLKETKNDNVEESSLSIDEPRLSHDYFSEYHIERQKNEIMKEQIDVLLKQNGILAANGLKFVNSATEYKAFCDLSDAIALQAAFGGPNGSNEINQETKSQLKYMEVAEKHEKGQKMDTEIMIFMREVQELEETNRAIRETVKLIFDGFDPENISNLDSLSDSTEDLQKQ